MKKLIFTTALVLCFGFLIGQTIKEGNVLGLHIYDQLELKPGVTMEQLEDFLVNRYAPAFNDVFSDMKVLPVKGIRGENEKMLGVIFIIESDKVRDKYWASEGVGTELGEKSFARLQPVIEEFNSLATSAGDRYTDWIIL